jgi:hypothetical protein
MLNATPFGGALRAALGLTVISLALIATGCGGAYQKLPVSKSQSLRNKVAGEFDGVTQSMQSIKASARSLSDVPPEMASSLNLSSLRKAMQVCFNTPVRTAKTAVSRPVKGAKGKSTKSVTKTAVAGCNGSGNPQVAGYQQLPDQSKAFVRQKIQLVDSLRQELRHGLPARLARLPKLAGSVPLEMAKVLAMAEAKHRVNLLLGGKWAARSTREKKQIDDDFAYLKGSTAQLQRELIGLPKDLASIGGQVVRDLGNFGRSAVSGR